ncbi:MAG: exonuclease subunit SbcD [bacterium]|nr:exonuclease subunit SbcD [bacterium]
MEIKFLHVADTHIGIENYGRLDAATGLHTRLQDFVKSLRFAFEEALKEEVDLVIFSGDAYRSCDPTPTHQREFASLIRMLAHIPIVMITGNHDSPVAFGKASSIDIFGTLGTEGVYIASDPRLLTIRTKSGPVQVACLPWLHRSRLLSRTQYQTLSQEEAVEKLQDLGAQMIESLAARVDPRYPAILAAHVAAADATFSGSEQTAIIGRDPVFLTSTLANPAFDYIALGHIHKF